MSKNVLVTAIGTAASTTIVNRLKQISEYYVIGTDMVPQNQVATSLDVDEYYQFPPSTGEEYIPFALDFCRIHNVDYYFAIIDNEVVNLVKNRDAFEKIGTKLCLPDYDFTRICHYKELFLEWIEKNYPQIAIKQYKDISEARNAVFPLFLKPHEGAASRGCRIIENFDELEDLKDINEIGKSLILQDFVDGKIVTVDCVRNRATKQVILVPRREYLRNTDGCGIAVEIFKDYNLDQICHNLVEELDLNGVANIEFFETKNGYRIIEINPRHSAGTVYSCMAGCDTVINAIHITNGEECSVGEVTYNSHFAKRYEAYRMD